MNKTVYGVLTILLNQFGFNKWVAGETKSAIIRTILGFVPVLSLINFVMGILLGIEILQLSDEEFEAKKASLDKYIPAL